MKPTYRLALLTALACAGAWALAADRSGRAGRRADATLHRLLC